MFWSSKLLHALDETLKRSLLMFIVEIVQILWVKAPVFCYLSEWQMYASYRCDIIKQWFTKDPMIYEYNTLTTPRCRCGFLDQFLRSMLFGDVLDKQSSLNLFLDRHQAPLCKRLTLEHKKSDARDK